MLTVRCIYRNEGGLAAGQGINGGFDRANFHWSALDVWLLAIGHGLHPFMDFTGYSHLVIGAARISGIANTLICEVPVQMGDPAADSIDFIQNQIIRRPNVRIALGTPLVSSGFIDSFSLVDVLTKFEEATATRIPAGKVQPKDMDTVSLMLSTAQRVGKPKK